MAPRARVAVYKACWLLPGTPRGSCSTADLVNAIEELSIGEEVEVVYLGGAPGIVSGVFQANLRLPATARFHRNAD